MLFVNLCALIDGELQNEPSIASFSNIVFEPKKVSIGDLFIGKKADILEALQNGAYGIVSTSFKISDSEVAWIKVKDIEVAKLKLLRYLVLKTSKNYLCLDSVELDIFKKISENRDIIYIGEDIEEAIKLLFKSDGVETIIFSDRTLFDKLDLEDFSIEIINSIKIVKNTLFLTSFTYKGTHYKDIKLPSIFVEELERVLNMFDFLNIKYSITKLHFISHFKPLFLDNYFKIQPFGSGTKVVIIESDKNLLIKEIEYIKKSAQWAKIALLLPKELEGKIKTDIDVVSFNSFVDLKKKNIFYYNFAIMLDSNERFENYLSKQSLDIKNTLF